MAREGSGITINPETNEIEASSIVKNFVTDGDIQSYSIEFDDETDEAAKRMASISVSPSDINIMKSLEPKNSTGAMKFSEICIDEEIGVPSICLVTHDRNSDGSELSGGVSIYSDHIGIDVINDDTGYGTSFDIFDASAEFRCSTGMLMSFLESTPVYFKFGIKDDGNGEELNSILLSEDEIKILSNNVKISTADNVEIANFLVNADSAVGEAPQIRLNGYLFINSSNRCDVIVGSGLYRTYRTNDAEWSGNELPTFDSTDSECLYIDHPVQVAGDLFFKTDPSGTSHGHIRNVAKPEFDTDAAPAWYVHKVVEDHTLHIYPFAIAVSDWTTPADVDKIKYPKVAAVQDLIIAGIAADQTQQFITPTPTESSMAEYFDCGIMLIGESENKVRIACSKIPSNAIDITVSVQQAISEGGVN